MSLALESVGVAVSGTAVGLAAVNQLWCAARNPAAWPRASGLPHAASERRRRTANRLMSAALVLNLVLGGAATIDWADGSIRGTQTASHPPLLWPLALLAIGALVSLAANTAQHHQHTEHRHRRGQAV